MDRLYWPRTSLRRSFQRGFASLDSPPSPAGASGAGGAGRTNPLTRHPLDGIATDVVWPEEVSRAGPEAAARSAAQGTGEDPGRSLHP